MEFCFVPELVELEGSVTKEQDFSIASVASGCACAVKTGNWALAAALENLAVRRGVRGCRCRHCQRKEKEQEQRGGLGQQMNFGTFLLGSSPVSSSSSSSSLNSSGVKTEDGCENKAGTLRLIWERVFSTPLSTDPPAPPGAFNAAAASAKPSTSPLTCLLEEMVDLRQRWYLSGSFSEFLQKHQRAVECLVNVQKRIVLVDGDPRGETIVDMRTRGLLMALVKSHCAVKGHSSEGAGGGGVGGAGWDGKCVSGGGFGEGVALSKDQSVAAPLFDLARQWVGFSTG
uniref:Uncharacterized protein n=1 Tax=Chromera velia CCMP2878 TaxID=1169474 RepID=A0A0K6S8B2_9ALVE|eukprot:Cvel_25080.t1-p1 / transcript=Cvel_25080.t1 / gene=Cvel_25080 / organism=Chromera_velia_CCMP2878 / gene_product=hypothetical protein / transcript_product=hypothetical protein / location=Cvel_scaffold2794:1347-2201(+) / protein_length=285 / sequence_SO=supercontig / SO=protein_coding / is_pseudo=false